jgi:hypothetical protein
MFRNVLCAAVVVALTVSFAYAQQAGQPGAGKDQPLSGKVVKIDKDTIVLEPYEATTKKFGKEREIKVTGQNVKVFRMGATGQKQPVAGGLQDNTLKNLTDKGGFAVIRMQNGQASEVILFEDQASWQRHLQNPGGANPKPGAKNDNR